MADIKHPVADVVSDLQTALADARATIAAQTVMIAQAEARNKRLDLLRAAVALCTNDAGLTDFATIKRTWFYAVTGRDEPVGDRSWRWLKDNARL